MSKEIDKAGESRDDKGKFKKGYSGNPKGLTPETEKEHNKKVAKKKVIAEYEEELREMLPEAKRVLKKKLDANDLFAVKEIHDRTMGKPRQNIGVDGGEEDKPITVVNYGDTTGKIPAPKLPNTDKPSV